MPTHSVIETVSQVLAATENLSIQFDPPADEARDGRFVPLFASSLHSELREVVGQVAPLGMFTHQHSAIESVLAGRHTIVATRTSSGKSLIFALPALDAMCRDDSATSLFLYPKKALANDQLAKRRGHPERTTRAARHSRKQVTGDRRVCSERRSRKLFTNGSGMSCLPGTSKDSV